MKEKLIVTRSEMRLMYEELDLEGLVSYEDWLEVMNEDYEIIYIGL